VKNYNFDIRYYPYIHQRSKLIYIYFIEKSTGIIDKEKDVFL